MAPSYSRRSSQLPATAALLFLLVSSTLQGAIAGRGIPADAADSKDKKLEKECASSEGTVLLPGIGRYTIGRTELPSIGGLDNSGPAAANQQFLPGGDDTFVPNPGYEIPNPFHGGAATP